KVSCISDPMVAGGTTPRSSPGRDDRPLPTPEPGCRAIGRPPFSAFVAGGYVMRHLQLRLSLAIPTGMAFALALPCAAPVRPGIGAPPVPQRPDRPASARAVALELVGRTVDGSAPGPLGLVVAGEHAYLAAWRRGLRVVRVSDPKAPREVGSCAIRGAARDVAVAGGHAYVAAGVGGLRVLDVSDPRTPTEVGSFPTRGFAAAVALAGQTAYVAGNYDKEDASQGGLRVVDGSDPKAPFEVGSFEKPGLLLGVSVAGKYAYAAYKNDVLRVVDVSDPGHPVEVSCCRGTGEGQGVVVVASHAYVPDRDGFVHLRPV